MCYYLFLWTIYFIRSKITNNCDFKRRQKGVKFMEENKNESQSNDISSNSITDTVTDSGSSSKDLNIKTEKETDEQSEKQSWFHVTTKYKWIFILSAIILLVTSVLIYAKYNGVLGAEYWQMAIWGVCVLLSLYSIFKKSLAALILNLILFFGISLLPAWGLVYQFFKPILELLLGTKLPEWRQPHYW